MEPAPKTNDYYRYCPGEERIKLSNAVCYGRRRSNYPKCKGCQFNDDERRSANTHTSSGEPRRDPVEASRRIEEVFKAYDVRGLYPEALDAEVAWRIGQATAQFLRSELRGYDRSRTEKAAVVVGRDMRKSSPELAASLTEGLRTGGSPVVDIGMVDTPQLYFAVNHLTCCGGVQVTASHNPGRYNGFKFCGQRARPISAETGLGKICKIAQNTIRHTSSQMADRCQEDLTEPYRQFVREFLRTEGTGYDADRPLRVVVDASNGMAGRWFPLLFGDVDWLDVIRLNFEHNGEFVHDPDPLVEANLAQACDRVLRSKAQLGVCFDGDADRCVFIDAEGRPVRSDLMTALLARQFLRNAAGSVVVYDLRSSRVVPEEIRKAGGVPRRERCGHAYVKKSLADARGIFAGELSGHFYFRDNWYCDSAMIAFVEVVNLLTSSGKPLHELVEPLRRMVQSGELSFEIGDKERTIRRLAEKFADGEIDYLDGLTVQYPDWWFNVRASNTEPLLRLNVEAVDRAVLESRISDILPLLGKPAPH